MPNENGTAEPTGDDDLARIERDRLQLEASPIPHLAGRIEHGLDPAGMMTVEDVKPNAAHVIDQAYGHTDDPEERDRRWAEVYALIADLHKSGPWKYADRLRDAADPAMRAYVVLAASCRERKLDNVLGYLQDKTRVQQELTTYLPEDFEARRALVQGRVEDLQEEIAVVRGTPVTVPVAKGDPALALAARGHTACVVDNENGTFSVQTLDIPDDQLRALGYVEGYGERRGASGFERVPVGTQGSRTVWVPAAEQGREITEMTPGMKRIFGGYVLVYGNRDLAVALAGSVIAPPARPEAEA